MPGMGNVAHGKTDAPIIVMVMGQNRGCQHHETCAQQRQKGYMTLRYVHNKVRRVQIGGGNRLKVYARGKPRLPPMQK